MHACKHLMVSITESLLANTNSPPPPPPPQPPHPLYILGLQVAEVYCRFPRPCTLEIYGLCDWAFYIAAYGPYKP